MKYIAKWIKSKTLWTSSILIFLAAIQANLTFLAPVMSSEMYGLVSFGLAMALFALRFVTTKPLSEK